MIYFGFPSVTLTTRQPEEDISAAVSLLGTHDVPMFILLHDLHVSHTKI